MKHHHILFHLLALGLALLAVAACSDEWEGPDAGGQGGQFRIELSRPAPFSVETRAGESYDEETVESAAVFVFAKQTESTEAGDKTQGFVLHSTTNVRYVDLYLTAADEVVYAVCNHPNPEQLVENVKSLADLQAQTLTINAPDGAHPGHYVMTGHLSVDAVKGGDLVVPLYRLAARHEFTIRVNTTDMGKGDGGEFKHIEAYLCNLPRGSRLLDEHEGTDPLPAEGCTGDYTYATDPDPAMAGEKMRANYFTSVRLNVTEQADGTVTAAYDMFENRRGSIPYATPEEKAAHWPELHGLEDSEDYEKYQQLFKRTRAIDFPHHIKAITIDQEDSNADLDKRDEVKEGRFYNATYLRIEGMYKRQDGSTYRTSYYVYLGADAFSDYNVRRNYKYKHTITIHAFDNFDHRVSGELLDGLSVYAPFDDVLDAHYNTVKALMYAPEAWTVSVENPDETPWLEVSHSFIYKPRLAGRPLTGDEASYSISGTGGLNYFYVHTDEYIPELTRPEENVTMLGIQAYNDGRTRSGTIVCRSKNLVKRYTVTQLPAEMVILHIDYDVHTMKEVRDTFYVERLLEQKYMPWGFLHFWSYTTDDLIASGTWDGLSNTRKLYDVGINGEQHPYTDPILPYYTDGVPSYDEALGYVVAKNRDRNGNGRIDYDEIEWYWPATKELEQIRDDKFHAKLFFEGSEETFFASTPSSSDRDHPLSCSVQLSRVVSRTDFFCDDYPAWDSEEANAAVRRLQDNVYNQMIAAVTPSNPMAVNNMLKTFTLDFAGWVAGTPYWLILGYQAWEALIAADINGANCSSFLKNISDADAVKIKEMLYPKLLDNKRLQELWQPWDGLAASVGYNGCADRFYVSDPATGSRIGDAMDSSPVMDIVAAPSGTQHTFTLIGFGENAGATASDVQNRLKEVRLYNPAAGNALVSTLPLTANVQSFAGQGRNGRVQLNYLPIKEVTYSPIASPGMTYRLEPVNLKTVLNKDLLVSAEFVASLDEFIAARGGKYGTDLEHFILEITLPDLSRPDALTIQPEWSVRE